MLLIAYSGAPPRPEGPGKRQRVASVLLVLVCVLLLAYVAYAAQAARLESSFPQKSKEGCCESRDAIAQCVCVCVAGHASSSNGVLV